MKENKVALYWVFIGILLVLISICSFFVYYFNDLKNTDLSIEKITLNESSEVNYKVKLLDNIYYNTEVTTNNYVTSLIDNINTNFNYTLSFDDKVTGEYSYFIVGTLISENNSEKILEHEVLRTKINKYKIDGNVINISSSFDIDLDEYLKVYNSFKDEYKLDLTGEINFDITVSYSVFNEKINKYMTNSKSMNVLVPVSEATTSISVSPKEMRKFNEYSELNKDENMVYLIIVLEFLGAILLFVIIIIALLKLIYNSKSDYQRKLNRILRKYDSLIVHIEALPDLSKSDVLFVATFKDLVDASQNLVLPINYVEVINNREAAFIITNENQAYVYKLKS